MSAPNGHIVITGVTGFIGAALARRLHAEARIVGLSRQGSRRDDWPVMQVDFCSAKSLRKLDKLKITMVVHLAAVKASGVEAETMAVNVAGTGTLLRYALARGCRHFLVASSIAAVGGLQPDFMPTALPITEDYPCNARDPYGLSKWSMERLVDEHAPEFPDAGFTLLRLGSVVDESAWVPAGATSHEKMTFPFVELARVSRSDVVAALSVAIRSPPRAGVRTYNLVGPDAGCVEPVATVLKRHFGARLDGAMFARFAAKYGDCAPLYAMERIKHDLAFFPKQSLRGFQRPLPVLQ